MLTVIVTSSPKCLQKPSSKPSDEHVTCLQQQQQQQVINDMSDKWWLHWQCVVIQQAIIINTAYKETSLFNWLLYWTLLTASHLDQNVTFTNCEPNTAFIHFLLLRAGAVKEVLHSFVTTWKITVQKPFQTVKTSNSYYKM